MTIQCHLSNLLNIKLLSYIIPDLFIKRELNLLRRFDRVSDVPATLREFLDRDKKYNMKISRDNILTIFLDDPEIKNFCDILSIEENSKFSFSLHETELEYTECTLEDIKENEFKFRLYSIEKKNPIYLKIYLPDYHYQLGDLI